MESSVSLPTRCCEACGAREVAIIRDGLDHKYSLGEKTGVWNYRLLQCEKCGMAFVDPLPSVDILNTFYTNEYGSYRILDLEKGSITRSKRHVAQWRMRGFNQRGGLTSAAVSLGILVEAITGRTVPATLGVPLQLSIDAVILDFGFGSGDWLHSMHLFGYKNLHGYDIDANSVHLERLRADGVKLSSGDFLKNDYSEVAFDCIRLSHVFEHLIDPISVLKKCRTMLKPGGFIVLSHPCFHSWLAKIGFDYSLTVQLPRHLYHHTTQSTSFMLEKAGFLPREVKAYGVGFMLEDTVNKKLRAHERPIIPRLFFKISAPFYRCFCYLTGHGDFISAVATTPD